MVLFELWYEVARSDRRCKNVERLRAFLSGTIGVVPFDEEDAMHAGDLRAALEAAGTPIRPYDLLIAAQALERVGAKHSRRLAIQMLLLGTSQGQTKDRPPIIRNLAYLISAYAG